MKDLMPWSYRTYGQNEELRQYLARAFHAQFVTDGYDHHVQPTIDRMVERPSGEAAAFTWWLMQTEDSWRGDFLRLLARAPTTYTQPWGTFVTITMLRDFSVEVREAAITVLGIWGGAMAKRALEEHQDPQEWLTKYARYVAREM